MPAQEWLAARHELERHVYYVETGGIRAPSQQHELISVGVVEAARQAGFPSSGNAASRARFDAECAKLLHSRLRLAQSRDEVPLGISGEILADDFWTWLALLKLPEVVLWRFGETAPDERFLGGFRNCFYRLWRRAWLLEGPADDRWSVLEALTEDAFVSIVERPGVSSNRAVARLIGECWREFAANLGRERMEPINRDAMKRIRALAPVLSFEAVGTVALRALLAQQYAVAAERLKQESAAPRSERRGAEIRGERERV